MSEKTVYINGKRLGVPIIQGGMGVGISLGGLAGAVAKAGGVGLISTAQIGFREEIFDRDPLLANLLAMEKEYKKARQTAPDGIIGFNIMTALKYYKEYVECACRLGADIIVSGAGLPVDLPQYLKGSNTAIAPIVSTKKSVHTLLKYWIRKYDRLPELIIVEGPEAGGHLGFTKEQLANYKTQEGSRSYEEEIKEILLEIKGYEKQKGQKIPVFVAGGIDSKERAHKVMALGASGVQVGTRFVTTIECDAALAYKEQYLKAKKEDIVIIKSPVGMPGRAIRNPWLERMEKGERDSITKCHNCLKHCDPRSIPYCITNALIAAAKGDMEHGLVFCGANVYKSKKLETVLEVIDSFEF